MLFILIFSQQIFSQTQFEMNQEARDEYVKSDDQLNKVYNIILEEYKLDSIFIERLKTTQQIWIKLRDEQVEMKYPKSDKSHYGSVFPMRRWIYLTKLT